MSAKALRRTLIGLSVLGLALASYLTYVHYAGIKSFCTIGGDPCTKVQTSKYSELAGVPVALMGLIGYVFILGSLLLPESENSRLATMVLTLSGFGFSAYLSYREVFTLKEICEWCATSAVILTVMMILSVWRFLRADPALASPAADAGEPAGLGPASA